MAEDGRPRYPVESTWPYLAGQIHSSLKGASIARHGREILARGATHGRLLAFIGAGVSMAYGRQSWHNLVRDVLREVRDLGAGERLTPEMRRRRETLSNELGLLSSGDEGDFEGDLPADKQLLILQLCEDVLQSAAGQDHETRVIAGTFRRALESPRAHDENLIAAIDGLSKCQWFIEILNRVANKSDAKGAIGEPARRHYLRLLQIGPRIPPREQSLHTNDATSPLAILINDFKIQRFATTNYDSEIQNALVTAGRKPLAPASGGKIDGQDPAPTDACVDSIVVSADASARAFGFAVDGRRRHASVLHLHGRIDDRDLIASERDYQRRYLRQSKRRDLLAAALRSLFAANPILYVGSSISEDDVLRPLREFMSRTPRVGDTLGVALLPAAKREKDLRLQKIEALLRYGIHIVHYGYSACPECNSQASAEAGGMDWEDESWLCQFTNRIALVEKRCRALAMWPEELELRKRMLEGTDWAELEVTLETPPCIDGQGCPNKDCIYHGTDVSHFDVGIEVELLNEISTVLARGILPQDLDYKSLRVLLDDLRTSVTSACLCARLKTEQMYRAAREKYLAEPAAPCQTDFKLKPGSNVYCHLRHEPGDLVEGKLHDRFAANCKDEPDSRWRQLFERLNQHKAFKQFDGRRLVLLPVRRGAGKGCMFEQLACDGSKTLAALQLALQPAPVGFGWRRRGAVLGWRCALVSLNFLSDVATIAELFAHVIAPKLKEGHQLPARNIYGRLEKALELCAKRDLPKPLTQQRVLIVLTNAGMLFDGDGREKNGLVLRLLRLLRDPRFEVAPIDFVVFCDEGHVPRRFRNVDSSSAVAGGDGIGGDTRGPASYEWPNRLAMQGIRCTDAISRSEHIFAPGHERASEVAGPFLGRLLPDDGLDQCLQSLHQAVGGNRIAITMILALCSEECGIPDWITPNDREKDGREEGITNFNEGDLCELREQVCGVLESLSVRLASQIFEDAPEATMQLVFDHWSALHMKPARKPTQDEALRKLLAQALCLHKSGGNRELEQLVIDPLLDSMDLRGSTWQLSQEILWHLSVMSHPVELAVLKRCPEIRNAVEGWLEIARDGPLRFLDIDRREQICGGLKHELVGVVADLCAVRCLALRVSRRKLGLQTQRDVDRRYTVHRTVQRYFLRMMGGRNIESIEWDQFATSMYASQPDEVPSLSAGGHLRIKSLIDALSQYVGNEAADDAGDSATVGIEAASSEIIELYQAMRAAYFVARSTYSVGVLSHIAATAPRDASDGESGHMEAYRRSIRWITHRAKILQAKFEAATIAEGAQGVEERRTGFFHAGELVWLYAECGVMSLTQGKLEDAESLLKLALCAARQVECDATGSLHARILLHLAMTAIERGRPYDARRMLEPIAARRCGHEMLPLIAEFYLGIIEHLGGEYHSASNRYQKALEGFRQLDRTRAASFVLRAQADLELARHPERGSEAERLAEEAVAVAQRGRHEDVRMLGLLTLVRTRAKLREGHDHVNSFALVESVERYGRTMDMPRILAAAHETRAKVLLSQGETRQSLHEAAFGADIAALYDLKLVKCKALLTMARVLDARGDSQQAAAIAASGIEMAQSADYFSCVRGFRAMADVAGR